MLKWLLCLLLSKVCAATSATPTFRSDNACSRASMQYLIGKIDEYAVKFQAAAARCDQLPYAVIRNNSTTCRLCAVSSCVEVYSVQSSCGQIENLRERLSAYLRKLNATCREADVRRLGGDTGGGGGAPTAGPVMFRVRPPAVDADFFANHADLDVAASMASVALNAVRGAVVQLFCAAILGFVVGLVCGKHFAQHVCDYCEDPTAGGGAGVAIPAPLPTKPKRR